MNTRKTLSLLIAVGASAVALTVPSVAQAKFDTYLCRIPESLVCSPPHAITHLHMEANELKISTNTVDVVCEEALFLASVLGLGNPQIAHITSLSWGGCETTEGSECVLATTKPGLLLILKVSENHADTQLHDVVWLFECGSFIHCEYGGLGLGLFLGADESHRGLLHKDEVLFEEVGGFFCPDQAFLDALYESLQEVWVES
jgi:hypothetical protein